ncbi:hypothetical protein [Cellulomonas carbonis]|nr:hypothetical protein [Cellulomonas carbonis]GGC03170.1 hypothetical protein GCM10010972_15290 [Cellulomonas carbonis]
MSADDHATRAHRHRKVGDALAAAGDEWAFVCFFYSAYHLVKAALLLDPVFDDPDRLGKSPVPLTADDRHVSRHKGRRRPGAPVDWGVNDLVGTIYRFIRDDYEMLHQLSIEVRYGQGRALPELEVAGQALKRIEDRFAAGSLKVTNF